LKNKIQEFDLSHKTDLRSSSLKHDVCLCDDGASFTPLESGLEAVLDPSLTVPSLVAPPLPSPLRDNTTFNMTLPDLPFSLAQSMEFEVGETFIVNASVDEDDVCHDSDNDLIEVHDSDAALVGRSYGDVVVTMPASPYLVENVSPDHLDALHVSPSGSPPPLPLSAILYHSSHVMICLRGMR